MANANANAVLYAEGGGGWMPYSTVRVIRCVIIITIGYICLHNAVQPREEIVPL